MGTPQAGRRRTITVLVPAFNEQHSLPAAVADVLAVTRDFDDFEILIVDDGSRDGTAAVAARLAAAHPHIRLLRHAANRGLAAAYRTGLAHARMDYFTFVPADHELTLESLAVIFPAVGQADLVVPYHARPQARAWHRRLITWLCTHQVNWLFGWTLRYYQGPVVYPTALARALPSRAQGFIFAAERLILALSLGCSYVEVGLRHRERQHGHSKAITRANLLNAQRTILRLWWEIRVKQRRIPCDEYGATGIT